MRKFVFYAAALAAMITVTSCSSDDDVVTTAPAEPLPQGTPFRVTVGNDTRADFNNTKTANLANFQLYGIQQTSPTKNFWMNGAVFTKTDGNWSSTSNPTWPTSDKETVSKFYGFSDGVTEGTPTGLTPSIENDAQSFTFTFGEGKSSEQYYSQYTQTQIDAATVPAMKSAWQAQRNNKKTTATVLENDRLTDLLVTKDDVEGTEGTDGTLSVRFKHALSNLIIKAMFVGDENQQTFPATSKFYIEWIRIYNLYTSGTYTFGGSWSSTTSDSKLVYEKVFGEADSATPDPRWSMSVVPYATYMGLDDAGKAATYQTIVGEGEFMVIPQDYSSRAYAGNPTAISVAKSAGQCYIEVCAYFKQTETTSATGQGSLHYFPLNITDKTFLAGKKHTVVLDLTTFLNEDGGYATTPSQAGGSSNP